MWLVDEKGIGKLTLLLSSFRAVRDNNWQLDNFINKKQIIVRIQNLQKILVGMMPTEEEKTKIIEAQRINDLQLGTAEQFLLTMGSISELESRLRLWIYKMDYDTIESVSTITIYVYYKYLVIGNRKYCY